MVQCSVGAESLTTPTLRLTNVPLSLIYFPSPILSEGKSIGHKHSPHSEGFNQLFSMVCWLDWDIGKLESQLRLDII